MTKTKFKTETKIGNIIKYEIKLILKGYNLWCRTHGELNLEIYWKK